MKTARMLTLKCLVAGVLAIAGAFPLAAAPPNSGWRSSNP
jgi:hypothetical protein